ncbi:sigma-70 family RNA polymerase sigma factor [Lacibacterium aquatile]|uniref:Sigma-70 family RNA polymerase sigma factor n=1 Tax=Lacibacterium aquatile TaxID=1168082 RepID=A0ABW5DM43_9PROT
MAGRRRSNDDDFDQQALMRGERGAWDRFVDGFTGVVQSAIRTLPGFGMVGRGEAADLAQDVFTALVAQDYRLLKQYDPARAAPATWLTIVARSIARDRMRRRQPIGVAIDDVPEESLSVPPVEIQEKVQIPPGLLSPRQELILALLYEKDMDPIEIAQALEIEAQTVRSQHHKALTKLRRHFAEIENPGGDAAPKGSLSRFKRS